MHELEINDISGQVINGAMKVHSTTWTGLIGKRV
jgi:hypothetical protein